MSDFKSWLKTYWDEFAQSDQLRIATAEIQSLTDYLEDRISVSNAARGFLGNRKAKDDAYIERHINILFAAALETSNPAEQTKIVKLFLAARNLQLPSTSQQVPKESFQISTLRHVSVSGDES